MCSCLGVFLLQNVVPPVALCKRQQLLFIDAHVIGTYETVSNIICYWHLLPLAATTLWQRQGRRVRRDNIAV